MGTPDKPLPLRQDDVGEAVCRCVRVSAVEKDREINSASTDKTPLTHPLELPSGNADVRLTHTEVRVGLPPSIPTKYRHDSFIQ